MPVNNKKTTKTVRNKKIGTESKEKKKKTRIEPVGKPYREFCLSPWKENWRMS